MGSKTRKGARSLHPCNLSNEQDQIYKTLVYLWWAVPKNRTSAFVLSSLQLSIWNRRRTNIIATKTRISWLNWCVWITTTTTLYLVRVNYWAFTWKVIHKNFIHRLKSRNHFVQHNTQYHRKVLLYSFHLNDHTLGYYPQALGVLGFQAHTTPKFQTVPPPHLLKNNGGCHWLEFRRNIHLLISFFILERLKKSCSFCK